MKIILRGGIFDGTVADVPDETIGVSRAAFTDETVAEMARINAWQSSGEENEPCDKLLVAIVNHKYFRTTLTLVTLGPDENDRVVFVQLVR